MYQPHRECITPDEGDIIWRYMDLTRFISLAESRSLFFCRADLFQDAFEGSLTKVNVERREALGPDDPTDAADIDQQYRKMREWTAINCWSCGKHESAAMWSLYCPEGLGVAIHTTFGRLCEAFKACHQWKVNVSRVTYIDYDQTPVPDRHFLAPFLHKRKSFEHEHEVRAVIQRARDPTMPDRASPFARIGGIQAAVELDTLIERIYVSPTAPEWYFELIKGITSRYQIASTVHQSSLSGDPIY